MMTTRFQLLIGRCGSIFLLGLCAPACNHVPTVATGLSDIATIEQQYADWLDATSAISTIDSGLQAQFDGLDRNAWLARQRQAAAAFSSQSKSVAERASRLSGEDGRALERMTNTFADYGSTAPVGDCTRAGTDEDAATLRADLYACFDSLAREIPFEGKSYTRVAVLQMLGEIAEPARREALFRAMLPLWRAINGDDEANSPYRRMLRATVADAGFHSPIAQAAASIGVGIDQVEAWLIAILEAWRDATAGAYVEPWDYRYVHAGSTRELSRCLTREQLLPVVQQWFADLGADPRQLGILYDLEPRAGKAPLAYSDIARLGREVDGAWRSAISRISGNYQQGGFGEADELAHEHGHAITYVAVRTRPAFFFADILFDEAFADVAAWSLSTAAWQQRYLGCSANERDSWRARMSIVMLDVAWGLFELRMLRDPDRDPNALWSDIAAQYLHVVPHPELSWWAVRAQLVDEPGYMINYGLGAVITAEVRERARAALGAWDAGNPGWYRWAGEQYLRHGSSTPLPSRLRDSLGHALSPQPLLRQIAAVR
ncbi:MAG: hypothetical protein R3E77_12120 [Steroidobacteraceae bacterium]